MQGDLFQNPHLSKEPQRNITSGEEISADNIKMEAGWKKVLADEFGKPYFKEIKSCLVKEYKSGHTIYPPGGQIFNAFNKTPFDKVKLVILGQDPYHGPRQANGLCFSVSEGVRQPPSLQNIFKELNHDLGIPVPISGNLEQWASQGVFLLNTVLTVRAGNAASHSHFGWQYFTDSVITNLSALKPNLVFILWGRYAQGKETLIDTSKHHIIKSPHPSPFSANNGFFGSRPFSRANQYLEENSIPPVDWKLQVPGPTG